MPLNASSRAGKKKKKKNASYAGKRGKGLVLGRKLKRLESDSEVHACFR